MLGRSIWSQLTERVKNGIYDFSVVVPITSAQIKALRATPITLAPAPGVGFINEFLGAMLLLDYGGSNAFVDSANNLAVRLGDGTGVIVSEAIETTGVLDQTADTITTARAKIDAIVSKANGEDKALVLHNTGAGEITGNAAGDNIVRVRMTFRVHSTGF